MHLNVEPYIRKQTLIAACVNIAHIVTGYSTGWSSPVLVKLFDFDQTPLPEAITPQQASWVASSIIAGLIFGPAIFGFLSSKLGRKPCMIIGSLTTILGYSLLTVALSAGWIYTGRFIKGVGLSGLMLTDYMYIGEIASPNIRGIILSSVAVSHTLGILLVYAIGPYVDYRAVSYIVIAILIIHASSCLYFLPESPVFHVLKGREHDARRTLQELGRSKDMDTELKAMVDQHKEAQASTNSMELFTIKSNRMALLITTALFTLNQAGGIMSVLFYATTIFESAASSVEPEIASIILGVTQLAGAIVTPFIIDKYGRKTLLLTSTLLCSIFLTIFGVYFYLEMNNYSGIDSLRWLPLFTLVSYLFSFSFGINVIPGTLIGETFRPNMRSAGSATAITIGCIAGFISTSTFGFLVDAAGSHTAFWMYAGINLIGFLFTLFVVPETRGRSLMEIEAMLGGNK